MINKIEKSFFFFNSKIERIDAIIKSDKKQYILAPLLPITSLGVAIYQLIYGYWNNNYWVFFISVILITSLLFTYLISVASVYFLQNKNIFDKYRSHTFSKRIKVEIVPNEDSLVVSLPQKVQKTEKVYKVLFNKEQYAFEKLRLHIWLRGFKVGIIPNENYFVISLINQFYLKKLVERHKNLVANDIETTSLSEEKQYTETVKEVFFSELQLKVIRHIYSSLRGEILDDDVTLEDLVRAFKTTKFEGEPFLLLRLNSKHCGFFLNTFFIPIVESLTGTKPDLIDITNIFKFKIGNGFKPVNYGSITRSKIKESAREQRRVYKDLLDFYKMSVEQKD